MIALTFAAIGVFCIFALFWTLPTAFLSGTAAAGAIALINSIGNLAGFGGPISGRVGEGHDRRHVVWIACACDHAPDRWTFGAMLTAQYQDRLEFAEAPQKTR